MAAATLQRFAVRAAAAAGGGGCCGGAVYKSAAIPAVASTAGRYITGTPAAAVANTSPSLLQLFKSTITTPYISTSSSRAFSSTSNAMSASKSFIDAIVERRTYYQLNNKPTISDDKIEDIVKKVILHTPSSFNSQSARIVLLLKAEHERFWDFVAETLKTIVPAENWPATEGKLKGFRAGYGTVLFFEDPNPVHDLQNRFPLYADKFPQWSEHTSAMHQYALWVALEAEGLGANLQHYNPVVDEKVQAHWNVPQQWSLKAQLVFGGRAGEPGPKDFKPLEERLFVHGK